MYACIKAMHSHSRRIRLNISQQTLSNSCGVNCFPFSLYGCHGVQTMCSMRGCVSVSRNFSQTMVQTLGSQKCCSGISRTHTATTMYCSPVGIRYHEEVTPHKDVCVYEDMACAPLRRQVSSKKSPMKSHRPLHTLCQLDDGRRQIPRKDVCLCKHEACTNINHEFQ